MAWEEPALNKGKRRRSHQEEKGPPPERFPADGPSVFLRIESALISEHP